MAPPDRARSGFAFLSRLAVIVAAALGALIGSKLPGIWTVLSCAGPATADAGFLPAWLGGKTLVGGILFAWLAVEAVKKYLGVKVSTGDVFVFPLFFAMGVGRLGCFLAGVPDGTQGSARGALGRRLRRRHCAAPFAPLRDPLPDRLGGPSLGPAGLSGSGRALQGRS